MTTMLQLLKVKRKFGLNPFQNITRSNSLQLYTNIEARQIHYQESIKYERKYL